MQLTSNSFINQNFTAELYWVFKEKEEKADN